MERKRRGKEAFGRSTQPAKAALEKGQHNNNDDGNPHIDAAALADLETNAMKHCCFPSATPKVASESYLGIHENPLPIKEETMKEENPNQVTGPWDSAVDRLREWDPKWTEVWSRCPRTHGRAEFCHANVELIAVR